jgi:hypothetical protein
MKKIVLLSLVLMNSPLLCASPEISRALLVGMGNLFLWIFSQKCTEFRVTHTPYPFPHRHGEPFVWQSTIPAVLPNICDDIVPEVTDFVNHACPMPFHSVTTHTSINCSPDVISGGCSTPNIDAIEKKCQEHRSNSTHYLTYNAQPGKKNIDLLKNLLHERIKLLERVRRPKK